MITAADLKTQTVKDLCAMARKMGLTGVHSMRKDQLVRAVAKAVRAQAAAKRKSPRAATGKKRTATAGARETQHRQAKRRQTKCGQTKSPAAKTNSRVPSGGAKPSGSAKRTSTRRTDQGALTAAESKPRNPRIARKLRKASNQREQQRDLSAASTVAARNAKRASQRKTTRPKATAKPGKDRIVLLVRDAFWLHACWDITRQSVLRAQAALSENWHNCRPVLRLLHVETGATTSTAEQVVREIPIHGGVRNWYIDLQDSPHSYRVDIGYSYDNDRFHVLARSNVVTTPRPGSSDDIDENWSDIAENYEKVFALSGGYEPSSVGGDLQQLFEERLRRPMGNPIVGPMGGASEHVIRRDRDFSFEVDAEMIIYGSTKANAHVTLGGEPVRLRPDGSFTVRKSMPDRRQVLPVVACSRDGAEQRTIVLAVERNTKVMEPQIREASD